MKVEEILDFLSVIYPNDTSEEWDYPGLVVGSRSWDTTKVLYAVDITDQVVAEAIEKKCDLIISHHPLFFKSVHTVSDIGFRGAIVNKLVENKIALYVGHTNVDKSVDGASRVLAKELKLENIVPIIPDFANLDIGLGAAGDLPKAMSFELFAKLVSSYLPQTPQGIKCSGDPNHAIKEVAIISGSGDFIFQNNYIPKTDVFISSDLRHHPVLDFRQANPNVCVIDVPHFSSEQICLQKIKEKVESKFASSSGLTGVISEKITDPFNFVINQSPEPTHSADLKAPWDL
ncbi:MAG: Nif3-like dinuclear metal center hexameric protein [Bifidobacteriaceae bacterium]|jgi:dinuclear metal center YbgI/SA1388 family protein|nr:Nif3-like dinuclear metal center hexameric protein [Bifidobacteriaceae bacterium]